MKILLTGANGFLNSRIHKKYNEKHEIISLTRKDLDITDFKRAEKIIKNENPDIIIHGAAMSETKLCEDNPKLAYRVNVDSALNIGRISKEIKAKLIFLSSEQVFNGNENEGPYKEDDKAYPNTIYGKTKLEAENLLKKEGDDLVILRLSWMFGLPERNTTNNSNLFWRLLSNIIKNESIKVSDNEFRGITYVYDLIDNLEKIFNLESGIYHFGSDNDLSTYDISYLVLKEIGLTDKRIKKLLIKDTLKYKNKKRDLRMSYEKIKREGIYIKKSKESVKDALKEFNFYL
ncbi:MAG: NAD(P)-dependent oxidoreductase [Firmicutes bacterium]|nr:NAD(P)-dependent oxidoreductase [Bacillota bacterium]